MNKEKLDKIADILTEYKWHNKPLDETIQELVEVIKSCSSDSCSSDSCFSLDYTDYGSDFKLSYGDVSSNSYSVNVGEDDQITFSCNNTLVPDYEDEIVLDYNPKTGVWEQELDSYFSVSGIN